MSEFKYYKSKEVYREKYYQMPKVFFTNEKYLNLSNDAKITYVLLKARFDYSVQNNWVDSEDNIYFIYTIFLISYNCTKINILNTFKYITFYKWINLMKISN